MLCLLMRGELVLLISLSHANIYIYNRSTTLFFFVLFSNVFLSLPFYILFCPPEKHVLQHKNGNFCKTHDFLF